ncbi:MAG: hypothetical protein ACK4S4_14445 [Pyrinomonadaceae bacterium]
MDNFAQPAENRGVSRGLLVGLAIGVLVVGGALLYLSTRPSMDEQMASVLEGSVREGSPEFGELTRDIIISTDMDKTVQSPTVLKNGIGMFIVGNIRNKGSKTITGLEVNVSVVTQFNEVLKERRLLVVPLQEDRLDPGETITVNVNLDGFKKDDDRANIRWKVTAIRVQ